MKVAREMGAGIVAHGCTGKGNDQVRFEVSFGVLAPDLEVLAPIRDANIPREKAIALADEWGIPIASVVSHVLGRREPVGAHRGVRPARGPVGGAARGRLRAHRCLPRRARPDLPRSRSTFERGMPVALDGVATPLPEVDPPPGRARRLLRVRAGRHDREPARGHQEPGALRGARSARDHPAHQALEDLTLERDVAHHKPQLEQRWADLVYDGQWFSPLRAAIDAYVDATQAKVTGEVRLRFEPGSCTVVGRRSAHSLYDLSLATYGNGDAFDQSDAEGYVRLYGLPLKVWSAKQGTGA